MDTQPISISPETLHRSLGTADAPLIVDVRRAAAFDRIACPWLIRRFIEPAAEFFYVKLAAVAETAERTGATPYDIAGAEFGHHGALCSFDAFIRLYDIADGALARLAEIVRGADTSR